MSKSPGITLRCQIPTGALARPLEGRSRPPWHPCPAPHDLTGQKGESEFSILRQMTKRFALMRESFPFNCSLSPSLDHDFGSLSLSLFCLITEGEMQSLEEACLIMPCAQSSVQIWEQKVLLQDKIGRRAGGIWPLPDCTA